MICSRGENKHGAGERADLDRTRSLGAVRVCHAGKLLLPARFLRARAPAPSVFSSRATERKTVHGARREKRSDDNEEEESRERYLLCALCSKQQTTKRREVDEEAKEDERARREYKRLEN